MKENPRIHPKKVIKVQPPARNFKHEVRRLPKSKNVANQRPCTVVFWSKNLADQLTRLFHHKERPVFCQLSRITVDG
jgi:hypothetical protein